MRGLYIYLIIIISGLLFSCKEVSSEYEKGGDNKFLEIQKRNLENSIEFYWEEITLWDPTSEKRRTIVPLAESIDERIGEFIADSTADLDTVRQFVFESLNPLLSWISLGDKTLPEKYYDIPNMVLDEFDEYSSFSEFSKLEKEIVLLTLEKDLLTYLHFIGSEEVYAFDKVIMKPVFVDKSSDSVSFFIAPYAFDSTVQTHILYWVDDSTFNRDNAIITHVNNIRVPASATMIYGEIEVLAHERPVWKKWIYKVDQ